MAGFKNRLLSTNKQEAAAITGKSQRQNNLRSTREQLVFLVVFVMFVLISINVDRNSAVRDPAKTILLHDGWRLETGDTVDLDDLPPGNHTLEKNISDISANGKALCLRSIDTNFAVYADGIQIYDYHPVIPKRLGMSYGLFVHTIDIPENSRELGIQIEPVFFNTPGSFTNVVIEDAGQYMADLFRKNIFSFGEATITLLIGLLALIVGLTSAILMRSAGIDFISFGTACALIGFVGINDTLLLQTLTNHPALIRVVTYVCLMLLPFPTLSFFASATGHSQSKIVPGMLVLCLVNFAVQVLLTYRGLTDYFYLVTISHFIILLGFVAAAWLVVCAVRNHTIRPELLRSLIWGLFACFVGVGIDLLRFHFFKSYGASDFTRIGVLVLSILIGSYLIGEQTRELRRKQKESMILVDEISKAFARVIDMKDRYTNGHSSRVAKYTAKIARELGYDEETVRKYYCIALLHDVGKIGIPKAVLTKPGKLTEEEYELIKSHTSKGYDVLKDISILPELATGAQAHHERPDGRGYPNHLKGDDIPRVAQIIAVADCFDAMYSDRPYRSRMNFDRVVSIISEVSGTQLTPDVVDAFLRLVKKGEFRASDDHGGGSMESIENIRKA